MGDPVLDPEQLDLAVRSIAGWELAGAAWGAPAQPLDDSSWARLWARVEAERLWLVMAAAVAAGAWPTTADQMEEVARREATVVAGMLRLVRELGGVADVLRSAGIEWRLLKGMASADHLWAHSGLRPFGDLDLLVRREDFARAFDLLLSEFGGVIRVPHPMLARMARFAKGTELTRATGQQYDVHCALVGGAVGFRIPPDDLFADPLPVETASGTVSAMGREQQLLHACIHAVDGIGGGRVTSLRDVAEGLGRLDVDLDTDLVICLAERWRCSVALRSGVQQAVRLFDLPSAGALEPWVRESAVPLEERVLWAGRRGAHPAAGLFEVALMPFALDSWRDRVDYLRGELFHEQRDPWGVRVRRVGKRVRGRW